MKKMIVGVHINKGKVRGKKSYKWFIPKSLDGQVEKGDFVLVKVGDEKSKKVSPVLVLDVLDNDKLNYKPVIKVLGKQINNDVGKKKEVGKNRGKFSEEDKEMIKACRAEGNTLKVIAEKYSCSISTIHKIIKE